MRKVPFMQITSSEHFQLANITCTVYVDKAFDSASTTKVYIFPVISIIIRELVELQFRVKLENITEIAINITVLSAEVTTTQSCDPLHWSQACRVSQLQEHLNHVEQWHAAKPNVYGSGKRKKNFNNVLQVKHLSVQGNFRVRAVEL